MKSFTELEEVDAMPTGQESGLSKETLVPTETKGGVNVGLGTARAVQDLHDRLQNAVGLESNAS